MRVELLAKGNVENVFNNLEIPFEITYIGEEYKIMEIEKGSLEYIEGIIQDVSQHWWYYSKGARTGTACDFYRVNGHDLIGWPVKDNKDTYKTLSDYIYDGLGACNEVEMYDYAVSFAKVNGMSVSNLFKIGGM